MTRSDAELVPISTFSRANLLSTKALRLYDQLGLLKPAYIDPDSGYRYYRTQQIWEANLIRFMRRMDMPLATIREVLGSPAEEAESLVREHLHRLEARAARTRSTMPNLISALSEGAGVWIPEVYVRTAVAQTIVSLMLLTTVDQLEQRVRESLDRLQRFIVQRATAAAGFPFGIYHGQVSEDEEGSIEVCLPVGQKLAGAGEINGRVLPAGQFANISLRRDQCRYPAVLNGYDAVYNWIDFNGYVADGPPYEVWCSLGDDRWEEVEVA